MKKFKCSQETTGFMYGYYHGYYGFGVYLYCYMGNSEGMGYGTVYEGWGDGEQGIVFLEEYPHHLIIL